MLPCVLLSISIFHINHNDDVQVFLPWILIVAASALRHVTGNSEKFVCLQLLLCNVIWDGALGC